MVRRLRGHREFARTSYAQEGEDLILERVFGEQRSGFYVDVGAHHPYRFSNTYLFYRMGWRGINVDATPGAMALFQRLRPRDINVEAAIADSPGPRTLYRFDEPALNTLDPATAARHSAGGRYRLVDKYTVAGVRLADLLATYLPDDIRRIDFLSIDVEGLDLAVLKSNDWRLHRPAVVIAEIRSAGLAEAEVGEVSSFLRTVGYRAFAKTVNSVFYRPIDENH